MRNKNLKEILVKLKNVYPADIWIYSPSPGKCYCTEGVHTFKKLYGKYLSILEEKWANIIQEELKGEKLIYIPSVDALKKWADSDEEDDNRLITEFYEDHTNDGHLDEYIFMIMTYLEGNDNIKDWEQFISDPDFIKDVFTDKGIYSLKVSDNDDVIRLGKPSLPLVTEKTVQKLFYNVEYDKEINLYDLTLKFNFTHFIVYMYYTAVPMHI